MKIIADENIAQVQDYFGHAGQLITLPGRAIDAASVADADVLLVRSITRVDAALLEGSRIRYVGTATSGADHVDIDYLQQKGIGFGWARGCNADPVVEYVFSALASLSSQHGFDWRMRTAGIIGCGEIGSRLARKLIALQLPVRIFDPFLAADHPLAPWFGSLEEVLQQDIVSFHTPLTQQGEWPSWHMLDRRLMSRLSPAAIVINAARGGVIDNQALLTRLKTHPQQLVVLDAWEGEPDINRELMQLVAIATPHIAGYSREGKLQGTRLIANDFAAYFNIAVPQQHEDDAAAMSLQVDPAHTALAQLNSLANQAYDIMTDNSRMQALLTAGNPGACFDHLRKTYPMRFAFTDYCVSAPRLQPGAATDAQILGFHVLF